MDEARNKSQWDKAAAMMSLLANCHRDPKRTRVFRPRDFHPYYSGGRVTSGVRLTPQNIRAVLKPLTERN